MSRAPQIAALAAKATLTRRLLRRLIASAMLAVVAVATLAWLAPNIFDVSRAVPRGAGVPGTFWTDGTRGGHWLRERTWCWDSFDLRRIIFAGPVAELPYYRRNEPPPWAATISLDLREGFEEVLTIATGWPVRAFACEWWQSWRQPESIPSIVFAPDGSLQAAANMPATHAWRSQWRFDFAGRTWIVPLRPIWGGLFADLGLAWAAWSILLAGPLAARVLRRRLTGRCVQCGYPKTGRLRGEPCPECGAA